MKFISFLIRWISQQLAIPFWIVGHIHLSIHTWHDLYEILTSVGLHVVVGIGFYLDYLDYKKVKDD